MKQLIPLPSDTHLNNGFTHKIIIDAAELATWTSGTAQALLPTNALAASSVTIPIGYTIGRTMINVITPFTSSGGAITTLTFSLGDGGSSTRYVNAVSLKTAAYTAGASGIYAYTAADTVDGVATIVGQTMASLNAGQLELYIELLPVPELVNVAQPPVSPY